MAVPHDLIFVLVEYDYQTGEWLPIECSSDILKTQERLEHYLTNNAQANHKICVVRPIPEKPWDAL